MIHLNELYKSINKDKHDLFQLQQKNYGLSNQNKVLYFINESNGELGFFAIYRYWMEYLYFADVCGYTPVIDAGKNCAYLEKEAIRNTNNVFEYYFKQPSCVKVSEVKHSRKVISSDIRHREMVELIFTGKRGHYDCNRRYKYFMSKIVSKYMKFNQPTLEYVNAGLKTLQLEHEKVLGIHIRGTDFRKKYNRHPVFVTEEECFSAIKKVFDKHNYSKLFLATDDQSIFNKFVNKYGNTICCYFDVVRSNDTKSVVFHEGHRKGHRYKLGLEVIRDMYTLSKCDGLIAGISQVAICAQINKLARKERYEDLIIIDKGIYNNHHYFHRNV